MEDVGRIQDPTFQTHRAYVTEQEAEISGMLDAYDNLAGESSCSNVHTRKVS